MAKREPGQTGPLRIVRPRHPLRFYKRTWRGIEVVSAWPRERPNWRNPVNLDQRNEMRHLAAALKDAAAEEQAAARVIARGSAYIWRDVLSRAMVGRLIDITEQEVMTPSEYLDLLSSTPGAILVRTADAWIGLDPGDAGEQLVIADDGIPAWAAAGGTGGLYGAQLQIPTIASSGFSTWVNQGSATVADTNAGILLSQPSLGGSHSWALRTKAAPTPPYKVRALVALNVAGVNNHRAAIGWYDGTNKLLTLGPVYGNAWLWRGSEWSTPTSFNADVFTAGTSAPLVWLGLDDNGTTAKLEISYDGENFTTVYSTTKAGSYLGSSGYSNILFGVDANNGAMPATLMSYRELT